MRIVILGAGPAGLTAAWELLRLEKDTAADITVVEETAAFGGIAATREHNGYRFDIAGHRFFSKNPEINLLWKELLGTSLITRRRLSRVLYKGRLLQYPLTLNEMLSTLSPLECLTFLPDYAFAQVFRRYERSFEDWACNHFGTKLYETFFKSYTEKVWGMPCNRISADWDALKIKKLSFLSAVQKALDTGDAHVKAGDGFEYPLQGAGMLWERMAELLEKHGVRFLTGHKAVKFFHDGRRLTGVGTVRPDGAEELLEADVFLSSIPLNELICGFEPAADTAALDAARGLKYRDLITVALILNKTEVFPDNWIYVQTPDVLVGRIQNSKNWSAAMVPDSARSCLGMEYFCQEGDRLWGSGDKELVELAGSELCKLGFAQKAQIEEGVVVRVKKAYPVYTLGYKEQVASIRWFLSRFGNLQVMGKNGLHRYNNQDHSMMTAMLAARNVYGSSYDVFKVNEDAGYPG